MKATSKTQKRLALAAAIVVTFFAVFVGEFSSHGESMHNEVLLDIDENALIERAIKEMEVEYIESEEAVTKTIKIFNQDYELVDIIHLDEGELVEDKYSKQLLNSAEYLSEFGNTVIYKVTK